MEPVIPLTDWESSTIGAGGGAIIVKAMSKMIYKKRKENGKKNERKKIEMK